MDLETNKAIMASPYYVHHNSSYQSQNRCEQIQYLYVTCTVFNNINCNQYGSYLFLYLFINFFKVFMVYVIQILLLSLKSIKIIYKFYCLYFLIRYYINSFLLCLKFLGFLQYVKYKVYRRSSNVLLRLGVDAMLFGTKPVTYL